MISTLISVHSFLFFRKILVFSFFLFCLIEIASSFSQILFFCQIVGFFRIQYSHDFIVVQLNSFCCFLFLFGHHQHYRFLNSEFLTIVVKITIITKRKRNVFISEREKTQFVVKYLLKYFLGPRENTNGHPNRASFLSLLGK